MRKDILPQIPAKPLHGIAFSDQAALDEKKAPAKLVAQGKIALHVGHGKASAQHQGKCVGGEGHLNR